MYATKDVYKRQALKRKYESEKIDVTMPAKRSKKGNLHPVTQVKDQLSEIFTSMGLSLIHIFTKIPEMFDNPVYLEPTFTLNGIPI